MERIVAKGGFINPVGTGVQTNQNGKVCYKGNGRSVCAAAVLSIGANIGAGKYITDVTQAVNVNFPELDGDYLEAGFMFPNSINERKNTHSSFEIGKRIRNITDKRGWTKIGA